MKKDKEEKSFFESLFTADAIAIADIDYFYKTEQITKSQYNILTKYLTWEMEDFFKSEYYISTIKDRVESDELPF
jgi:hypothetical protein